MHTCKKKKEKESWCSNSPGYGLFFLHILALMSVNKVLAIGALSWLLALRSFLWLVFVEIGFSR